MDEPTAQVSRRGLLVALALTVVALPLLVLGGLGRGSDATTPSADPVPEVVAAPPPKGISLAPTAPREATPAAESATGDTTPTTRAVTPPTTTVSAVEEAADSDAPPLPVQRTASFDEGQASWSDLADGTCNHRTVAFETVVRVTNTTSGVSTTCVVAGRGPYVAGRIIELDRTVFGELAAPSATVVTVRIEW